MNCINLDFGKIDQNNLIFSKSQVELVSQTMHVQKETYQHKNSTSVEGVILFGMKLF